MRVVEMSAHVTFIVRVQRRVDSSSSGCLCLGICGVDLDFLQQEEVRPFPALETCSQRGLRRLGSTFCRRLGEEVCDFCSLGWKEGTYAIDVPGVDG